MPSASGGRGSGRSPLVSRPSHVVLQPQRRDLVEEQRLRDHRLDHFLTEGLGDQESRLGSLARQQRFRIGGDEDDRHLEACENVVDRIEPRGPVGEANVG